MHSFAAWQKQKNVRKALFENRGQTIYTQSATHIHACFKKKKSWSCVQNEGFPNTIIPLLIRYRDFSLECQPIPVSIEYQHTKDEKRLSLIL